MADAKKAINEDDARGYRKRVAKAKRIKGETVTKAPTRRRMKPKPKPSGEPPNRTYPFGPGNARNKNYPGLFDPNYEKGKKKK